MQKLMLFFLLSAFAGPAAMAHVGSANVYYEGDAGPYHLYVSVVLPKVVPGIADLQIRSSSPGIQSIEVVPMRLAGSGSSFSALPDRAVQSKNDPQFFQSSLWLMEFGAMKVRLTVHGARGTSVLAVPIASYAQQSLPMSMLLKSLMLLLILLLLCGVVLVPAAVVRESNIPAGRQPTMSDRRRGRFVTACSVLFAVFLLYAGSGAWKAQAAQYDTYLTLLKPPMAQTVLRGDRLYIRPESPLRLPLVGQDTLGDPVRMDQLLSDHGHRMHLFLVDDQGMRRMWHLHPEPADDGSFVSRLPSMREGRYKVFADIVDRTGYPWTLVGDVSVHGVADSPLVGDDSGWSGPELGSSASSEATSYIPGGDRIVFDHGVKPLLANVPGTLRFVVYDRDGKPARDLEPYMGMAAHAEVVCSDWSVFAHLHPSGSISMPSITMAAEGPPGMTGMIMNGPVSPELHFPFGFPHPGAYRVFVQIRQRGEAKSAAFDIKVQ